MSYQAKKQIKIGTSGWMYKHWKGMFYPDGFADSRLLEFYSQNFDTVEINNTFYKLPESQPLEKWYEETPGNFLFAVKANRYITHMKKLKDVEDSLTLFLERVVLLKDKLGPILFQLPPGWNCNYDRLNEFLSLLPDNLRYTFEFRNETWINDDVLQLLQKFNTAFCIYDLAGICTERFVTADFVYIRLHGAGESAYTGKYDSAALDDWALFIAEQAKAGKDVYCYFDNDQNAYAPRNAASLLKKVVALK